MLQNISTFFTKKRILIVLNLALFLTFILFSIFFLNFNKYQINPDAVDSFSVTLNLLNGNFYDFIHGYRSPLYSLLLAPFIMSGMEPLFAAKILSILVGFFILFALKKTVRILLSDNNLFFLILFFIIPVLTYFMYSITTSDLLAALFTIMFFNLLLDKDFKYSIKKGFLIGMLIGFGYLSKSFNLVFFVIILILYVLFDFFFKKSPFKKILVFLAIMVLMVVLIAGPWIALISYKYGEFSVSTVGELNYKAIGPNAAAEMKEINSHLLKINTKEGFANDDMTAFSDQLSNWFDIKYLIKRIILNFFDTIKSFDKFKLIALTLITIILVKGKEYLDSVKVFIFYILYILGYSFLMIGYVDRFFYALLLIGYILCFKALFQVVDLKILLKNKIIFIIVFLYISASFLATPLNYLVNSIKTKPGIQYYYSAIAVRNLTVKGNIASSSSGREMKYITYYNREDMRYYGTTLNDDELKDFEIDYYFCAKDKEDKYRELIDSDYEFIGSIENFYVFKTNN
jgi:4-amino-4-deoxy-L-arabinose transferase-like glycosyltransferase